MLSEKLDAAKKMDCQNASSTELFTQKFNLIDEAMRLIENTEITQTQKEEFLKEAFAVVNLFGYEIAFNRTFEHSVSKFHVDLVHKLFELSKKIFLNKPREQLPFYKEQLQYTQTAIERSKLESEIAQLLKL